MANVRLLAKLAGVSIATVSRAINGHPSIRPETRDRIMALAKEYQYHPNRLSQSVMSGSSTILGVLVPNLSDPYFSRILSELIKCAYKEDYHVIMLETFSDYKRTVNAISSLIEHRVAGIFSCNPCEDVIPQDSIFAIQSNNIRLVSIDYPHFPAAVDAVLTDEDNLAMTAVRYLCNLGHQNIGFFGPVIDKKKNSRTNAIYKALQQHGIKKLTNLYDSENSNFIKEWRQLDKKQRLTAIICWNDYYALKLMQMLKRAGVSIPQDISIMGYGNFIYSELLHPSLTTTEQHPEEMAGAAYKIMLERISQTTDISPPVRHLIPAQLIYRESCIAIK